MGTLSEPVKIEGKCPKCGDDSQHTYQIWTSYDEAFEDEKHKCGACNFIWWIDGIDS